MSYQVLARRWRPRNFSQMVGQQHALKPLINALDNDSDNDGLEDGPEVAGAGSRPPTNPMNDDTDTFPAPVYKDTVLGPLFEIAKRYSAAPLTRINR